MEESTSHSCDSGIKRKQYSQHLKEFEAMSNQDAPICNTDKISSIPESNTGPLVFREKKDVYSAE